jgi:hypothetical protein
VKRIFNPSVSGQGQRKEILPSLAKTLNHTVLIFISELGSRKSCMEDDELSAMTVTHFSSSQTPMIAMTHVDIAGISDMVEEPCVGIVHKGHMDLQTQEERHDLELVDLTHAYQYEESESPILEIPLIDQVVESRDQHLVGTVTPRINLQ